MPEIRAGDSSSPALIQPELLPETLDGSSPVSQIEVIDVDPLASMPEIADGSLQYSPLKTLGSQSSETCLLSPPGSSSSVAPQSPDLQEVLQVEPLSPSPFNLVGNSLPDYELNPQSEPTGPWRWSSRWASSSSTKESEILSDFPFPIEDSELSAAVGAGLSNMGNTCFINAILQCFTHTVPLVEGLRSCNHSKPCECASERFCVFCALRDHVDLSIASSGRVIRPWKLVNNLNYFSSYFQRYQQEDAHEFLQCFLDKLERSCLDSMEKTDTSCVQDKNLVEKVFGGRLQSKLRCCNCGHCSDTYEPLIDLSLEIEDVDSLPKALESFTKIEKINDLETKFTCDSCKEQVSVEKQLVLDQAPPVAAFHLKRFKTDGTHVEKIEKHVEFPLELDLKPYSSCSGSNVELKYELYAIVEHVGFSSTSGHYFCFIRSSPGTWHRLDDSKVTRVQEEFVLSQEAYILFYARQGTPWFSSIMEAEKPCLDPAILNTSPKSVLENVDSISNLSPSVMNVDCCTANVRRDAHERISLSLRQARPEEVEVVDTSDAASGPSEQNIASMDYIAAVTGASTPAGVSNSVNGASYNNGRCTTSSLGGNNSHKKYAKVVLLPTTPPRSRSPDVPYESPEPIYRLPRDQSKSADNVSCKRSLNDAIRGDHLKSADNVSCKRQSINSLGDPKRIEAFRYLQKNSLTRGRGSQLLAAMAGTQGSFNKKRKIAGSSPCKRVNPAGGSHKSNRTVRPMAAALR